MARRGWPRGSASQTYGLIRVRYAVQLQPSDETLALRRSNLTRRADAGGHAGGEEGEAARSAAGGAAGGEGGEGGEAGAAAPAHATGAWVRVIGLVSAPQHNGQVGQVVGLDTASGRCRVRLASSHVLSVRAANIEPCEEPAAAPAPATASAAADAAAGGDGGDGASAGECAFCVHYVRAPSGGRLNDEGRFNEAALMHRFVEAVATDADGNALTWPHRGWSSGDELQAEVHASLHATEGSRALVARGQTRAEAELVQRRLRDDGCPSEVSEDANPRLYTAAPAPPRRPPPQSAAEQEAERTERRERFLRAARQCATEAGGQAVYTVLVHGSHGGERRPPTESDVQVRSPSDTGSARLTDGFGVCARCIPKR